MADDALTVAVVRASGRMRLESVSDTPALDADVLLEHVTGFGRTELITRSRERLPAGVIGRFEELLERRLAGEPVAYLVGSRSFRTLDLIVDRRVLVPRPETEHLVDVGMAALSNMPGNRRVLDVGTGSGAIALALATELSAGRRSEIRIVASDISHEALEVAALNRDALGLREAVELVKSDLLDSITGHFDVILANLPYLRSDQGHPSTASEPEQALYAGNDGLDLYRRLFKGIPGRLAAGGLVAVEIDPDQTSAVEALAGTMVEGTTAVLNDLAGLNRVVVAGPVDIVRTVSETSSHGA